jgi:endonuclease-3 related protein
MGSARPVLVRWRRIPGPPRDAAKARLLRLYVALERRFGAHGAPGKSNRVEAGAVRGAAPADRRRRGPGRTAYEIAAGAILVQFTAGRGAARVVSALRARGLLSPARLAAVPEAEVARAVRPVGTRRLKVRRLRAFTRWLLERFDGRFEVMRRAPLAALRRDLLGVHGIGPETADAILLHAAGRPVFVADESTRRVLERHRLVAPGAGYEATRAFVEAHLPSDPALFSAYRSLLVAVGQEHCGPVPHCQGCPLRFDLMGGLERAPQAPRRSSSPGGAGALLDIAPKAHLARRTPERPGRASKSRETRKVTRRPRRGRTARGR